MEEVLTKIDWNVLNTYIENNLIVSNKHPEYDIWILNYSPKAQSKKFWDEYTMSCRGLVVDIDGNIISRCMKKFKNYEEHDPSEIDMLQSFEIFEKMDGSMISVFWYDARNEWIVASRGSFISEQSVEARKILSNKSVYLEKNNTYIFEVIYPENQIVVHYNGIRSLVLLTVIETKSGIEAPYDNVLNNYVDYFTIVKKYDIKNINNLNDLKILEEENHEGFVVKFADGFRVKVKFNEYIRLHGILTNVSNVVVWEHLMNNYNFDLLLDRVPDEFYDWLRRTVGSLQLQYNDIERLALKDFIRIYHINNISDRKAFAMEAIKTEHRSILFRLYDKKPYDVLIWKQIRPVFSKPFKDGYEYVS